MLKLWPVADPVQVRAEGLVLREWQPSDIPALIALYDTAEMDRWTPVASPFDVEAARRYLETAHRAREQWGTVQMAITEDGWTVLGEMLAFPADSPDVVELAYAVAAAHKGRGLATRAVTAVLKLAANAGVTRARLLIAFDNATSRRVAQRTGFSLMDRPLIERRRKGYVLRLETWERLLTSAPSPPRSDAPD
ncbi:MAG: GNAT family N-acetyltransferase [Nocardioidaceae bacterium]